MNDKLQELLADDAMKEKLTDNADSIEEKEIQTLNEEVEEFQSSQVETSEEDDVDVDDSFLREEDMTTLKYLQRNAQINDINRMIDAVKSRCDGILNDDNDEIGIYLDEIASKYTEDEIKAMSDEEITNIYTYNGEPIGVSLEGVNENDFKRDYLILRKQSKEATEKFDAEIERLNAEIAESQEEFNKAISQFGSVSNLVSTRLDECIADAKTVEEKERFLSYRIAFDNAFNLDNVIEFAKSPRGKAIYGTYRDDKKAQSIYKRYIKVCNIIRNNNDLTRYYGLEAKFLGEDYNTRPNVFLFTVISLVASWYNKPINKTDVVFLSQFNINIRNLYYNNFETKEIEQEFISNIKKVVEVFM